MNIRIMRAAMMITKIVFSILGSRFGRIGGILFEFFDLDVVTGFEFLPFALRDLDMLSASAVF